MTKANDLIKIDIPDAIKQFLADEIDRAKWEGEQLTELSKCIEKLTTRIKKLGEEGA